MSKHHVKGSTPMEDAEITHPSQDTTNRCSLDALLRKHGWVIVSRKHNQEAIWKKGDEVKRESIALAQIPDSEKR